MFNRIRQVFRESVDALAKELSVREPEDQVAELLTSMRKEMVAARAAIPGYEEAVERTRTEVERERSELEKCERRQAMAERIGDDETARIASEYAARHREKLEILEVKQRNAAAELEMRRREVAEMMRRYKEADANRFGLVAQLRAQAAARRMDGSSGGAADAFDDFARMEERVEDNASYADALEEMSEDAPPPPPGSSVDDRLAELKRRMSDG